MRIMDTRVKVEKSYQIHLELTAVELAELKNTLDSMLMPSSYISTRMPPIMGKFRDALDNLYRSGQ